MLRMVWLGFMIGAVCALPTAAEAQSLLRWKFTPGQQLHVDLAQTTQTTSATTESVNIQLQVEMRFLWDVKELDDSGKATIEQTVKRISLSMKFGNAEEVKFDSDQQQQSVDQRMADMLKQLVGLQLVTVIDPLGNVTNVEWSQESQKKVGEAAGPWRQVFSKDGMNRLLRQTALTLPEKEVSVGDSWSVESEVGAPVGLVAVSQTYNWKKNLDDDANVAVIDVETKLTNPKAAAKSFSITESSFTGTRHFDVKAGQLKQAQSSQQMTVKTVVGGAARATVTVQSTSEMKLEPVR